MELSKDLLSIINEVRNKIRPTNEELSSAYRIYKEVKRIIEDNLSINYEYKVTLQGSLAKGTCLHGDIDIDVFILIRNESMDKEWIENLVLKPIEGPLSKLGVVTKRYASHPYLQVKINKLEVDVVPAYWARSIDEVRTSVDRTPFHTEYVISRLSNKSRDEVRLLKKFLKGINAYGAEIAIEGFSGYLCELLIIKYGSFLETLKNICSWKSRQVVIIENEDMFDKKELLKVFRDSILIVPDPIDPRRNVAAAVSKYTYEKVILASRLFLKKPSLNYFFPTKRYLPLSDLISELRRTNRELVIIDFDVIGNIPPDILWGELKRIRRSLINLLKNYEFNVIDSRIWASSKVDRAIIVLDILPTTIPKYKLHIGPPPHDAEGTYKFVSKYLRLKDILGPWVSDDGRLYVIKPRSFTNVFEAIRECLNMLPRYSNLRIKNIYRDEEIPNDLINSEDFLCWLTEVVTKKPFWLLEDM